MTSRDGGKDPLSSEVTVMVQVADENDNKPQMTANTLVSIGDTSASVKRKVAAEAASATAAGPRVANEVASDDGDSRLVAGGHMDVDNQAESRSAEAVSAF